MSETWTKIKPTGDPWYASSRKIDLTGLRVIILATATRYTKPISIFIWQLNGALNTICVKTDKVGLQDTVEAKNLHAGKAVLENTFSGGSVMIPDEVALQLQELKGVGNRVQQS